MISLRVRDDGYISLDLLSTERGLRGLGLATQEMDDLCKHYDVIYLEVSDAFGSDVNRLIEFYSRFGFKMTGNELEMRYVHNN